MPNTANYNLKKPSTSDNIATNINIDTPNNLDIIDTVLGNVAKYETADGTPNAIVLTGITLINGNSKTFIVSANNNGQATTINDKPLYKPGTTTAPNLSEGKAVTVWYNASGDCFFIKASAEGNAVADHVLAGKTFSNDNDTDVEGTMPNNGSVSHLLPVNGSYTIPEGYHDGSGKVTQNIPTKEAQIYIPSTTDQVIAGGQYLAGEQVIQGDPNLISANILSGKSIFGVNGNATTGKKFASGNIASSSAKASFTRLYTGSDIRWKCEVSGLTFEPKCIYIWCINTAQGAYQYFCYYYNGSDTPYQKTAISGHVQYGASATDRCSGYKADISPAYVNSTGFCLPMWTGGDGLTYYWIACE